MRSIDKLLIILFFMFGCSEPPYWDEPENNVNVQPCATVCTHRILTICDEDGRAVQIPCEGETPYCGYDNGRPVCVPPVCNYNGELLKTGETSCSGTVKVTCMEDNWALHENCVDKGLVCRHGDCVSCEDGSAPFCFEDPNVKDLKRCTCEPSHG